MATNTTEPLSGEWSRLAMPLPGHHVMRHTAAVLGILALAACTSTIATNEPPVSATQQLIVSSSEIKAVSSLPTASLGTGLAYVDASEFTGSKFELALFKGWVLRRGTPLTDDLKSAQTVIVPSTGVDSYNLKTLLFGIPAIKISGMISLPEIALYGRSTEIAINQISFYAFDRKTGRLVNAETSKYGLQPYSVTRLLFVMTRESPKIAAALRAP